MRQLQENETDTKTHIMEANMMRPHAGGLTCRGGRHSRRTLQRTHRFTYMYKQHNRAHQEHTMHLTGFALRQWRLL